MTSAAGNWKVLERLIEDERPLWGAVWMLGITGFVPLWVYREAYNTLLQVGPDPILIWGVGFASGLFWTTAYLGSAIVVESL